MTWDRFKIKTTEKCPRGVIYMHPDDAAEMRPKTLAAAVALVGDKRMASKPTERYRGHSDADDDAARARVKRQFEELKARRAAGGTTT